MNNYFIKLLTGLALSFVFILQGIWLYNTYSILEQNLRDDLEKQFSQSIENVIYYQLSNSSRIPSGKVVPGAKPDNGSYINALGFQDFLECEGYPFLLNRLDTIWGQTISNMVRLTDYSICRIDSAGNILEGSKNGRGDLKKGIQITKPIKMDGSELLQTIVASPNRIVFERMILLLVTSMLMAVIIGYCIYLQIKIIFRQGKIAEKRQDLTHAMVHEMKNPVTTILMAMNSLKSGKLDDKGEMQKRYFDIVADESEHLLALTNKILTIAKFEDEKIRLSKADIRLKPMFDQLIEKYSMKSSKDFSAEVIYNGVTSVYADKDYLYDVFDNLFDNAAKYAKEKIQIQITCSSDREHTTLAMKDWGIGISSKDQKKIFDKYERILSPKEENRVNGFGLGLNYVYQVVTAHGGSVFVNSVVDSYSEFILNLPNKK